MKDDLEPIKQKSNVTIFKKVINSRESCKDKAEYRKSLVNLLNDSLVLLFNHEIYNGKNFGEIFDEFAKSDLEGEIKSTIDGVKSFRINSPTDDIITADKPYKIIKLGTVTLNITGGK